MKPPFSGNWRLGPSHRDFGKPVEAQVRLNTLYWSICQRCHKRIYFTRPYPRPQFCTFTCAEGQGDG